MDIPPLQRRDPIAAACRNKRQGALMKLKFAQATAALSIAAAAILAPVVATSASAAVLPYPPAPSTVVSGNNVTINFEPGSFSSNETVTIFLNGFNASAATLATIKTASNGPARLGTVESSANGSAGTTIVLPSNATGTYTVTGTSPSRPEGVSVTFTVAGTGTGGDGGGQGSLPATGMDSGSLLGLWVGGGALVLAGGAVAVGTAVHRQRKQSV